MLTSQPSQVKQETTYGNYGYPKSSASTTFAGSRVQPTMTTGMMPVPSSSVLAAVPAESRSRPTGAPKTTAATPSMSAASTNMRSAAAPSSTTTQRTTFKRSTGGPTPSKTNLAKKRYLLLTSLAFTIGASAGGKLEELIKEEAGELADKRYRAFLDLMRQQLVDQNGDPVVIYGSTNTIATMIPALVALTVNLSTFDDVIGLHQNADHVRSRGVQDPYSFLLLLGSIIGIESLVAEQQDVTTLREHVARIVRPLPLKTQLFDAIELITSCTALIARSIVKYAGGQGEKERIGETIYYLGITLSKIGANEASFAVLEYFETRWRYNAQDGTTKFRGALSAENTFGYITNILAPVKDVDAPTKQLLFNFLYSVELYLFKTDGSFYLAYSTVSFVASDVLYPCALVCGWYGLKYGIKDQEKNALLGIPPWAIRKEAYNVKSFVDASNIMFGGLQ